MFGVEPDEGTALDHVLDRLREAGGDPERVREVAEALEPEFKVALITRWVARLPKRDRQVVTHRLQRWIAYQPQTPGELWHYIAKECLLEIPRVAVCDGHCAPFDLISDAYFEKGTRTKLGIGNRGGGKTQNVAALHTTNARTKPWFSGLTAGAILPQAEKCQSYVKRIADRWPKLVVGGKVATRHARFTNGAEIEVVTGTIAGVNSPHPRLAHIDEVELLRHGVFEEAMNMAQSDVTHGYRAQNLLTSSWKKVRGLVTNMVEASEQARRDGRRAAVQVYRWCIFEVTEQCHADCAECPFRNAVRGTWSDGSPRSFEDECKGWTSQASRAAQPDAVGKLKRSRGFGSVEDAVERFMTLAKRTWDAQQRSSKPDPEGLVYDDWDEDRFSIDWWEPGFEDDDSFVFYGPIDAGVDYGGTDPNCFQLWQRLRVDVQHENDDGTLVIIPAGSSVCFDEIYVAEIGAAEFGRRVNQLLISWERDYPGFRDQIEAVYRDPAAKQQAIDWRHLSNAREGNAEYRDIHTERYGGIEIDFGITMIHEQIGAGAVWVDRMRCPMTVEEFGTYEEDPQTGVPVDADNHAMDAMRYRFTGRHVKARRGLQTRVGATTQAVPRATSYDARKGARTWDQTALSRVPAMKHSTVRVSARRRRRF